MVDTKLLSEKELFSLINLLGFLHQDQAKTSAAYKAKPSAELQMKGARINADIGTIPAIMLMHPFMRKERLREAAEDGALDMNALRKTYPNLTRTIPLIQRIDDQADIALDILDEIRTGRPSTNYILAKAHQLGNITHESGRLIPSIVVHTHAAFKKGPRIPVETLHPAIFNALEETDKEFREQAAQFNPVTRGLLLAGWEHGLRSGIKPANNERLDQSRLALGR